MCSVGRPQEAIEHYVRAIRLKPDYTQTWFNLANAYAQANHPAEAIATAKKTLDLARSQGQTAMAKNIEDWLIQYRANHADVSEVPASGKASDVSP
jgi:tetratricopeptide (TPR) repeat protein